MVGIELQTNWPRGKARAGLLHSEIMTSREDKKKGFAFTTVCRL